MAKRMTQLHLIFTVPSGTYSQTIGNVFNVLKIELFRDLKEAFKLHTLFSLIN